MNSNFDHILVHFTVANRLGEVVHKGRYWLDSDVERRAFGQRCNEAIKDGFVITTCREME